MPRNKYCNSSDLVNEASVETLFVDRLIADLGFGDNQVKRKQSIDLESIRIGAKKLNYKPDYLLLFDGKTRVVIDAKSPTESPSDYILQAAGYAWMLNSKHPAEKTVEYFVLTNGLTTLVCAHDSRDPILQLAFEDFHDSNSTFQQLRSLLSIGHFSKSGKAENNGPSHTFTRPKVEDLNNDFAWCHQHIYKKGNISQASAFEQFVKVIFLKLLSDRRIRDKYPEFSNNDKFSVPSAEVRFSTRWIKEREADTPNPLDTIQFKELLESIENEIRAGTRKRIFPLNDFIDMTPEIIRGVVGRLEHVYLLRIDTDLNGRLFETFLTATMRGKDLGQFFTPRSIVHLGTCLAELTVTRSKQDTVWDACGGTAGFLIDALAQMWHAADLNPSMSKREKEELKNKIATQSIRGVDIGREPNMSRLARMNMYLHGDGGSGMYEADALDKELAIEPNDSPELRAEKNELRTLLSGGGVADVVLTNPPFAKEYSRSTKREERILDQYRLAFDTQSGKRVPRNALRSSLLFIERYHDILKVRGRLVTVIDDGILSGQEYAWFRNFIRANFAVRGVVSLPGDAFQRSDARVKTSLLLLEKCERDEGPARQGAVFMFPCRYVGIDDPARRRVMPIDRENRINARAEIEKVVQMYAAFRRGDASARMYTVQPERIADRLDVKFCLEHTGRKVGAWKKNGFEVTTLEEIITPVIPVGEDVVVTKDNGENVTCIVVGYDGLARRGEEMPASDMKYSELYRVHTGNIVVSNISAHYGAVAIVPDELDGCVVTKEISVFCPKGEYTSHMVWVLLRSPEILADLLLSASGANRTRIDWDGIKHIQVVVPPVKVAGKVDAELTEIEKLERDAAKRRAKILSLADNELQLSSAKATEILDAYKPPK